MDINNPNRDLSDPSWISAGAAHARDKAHRERIVASREARKKEVEHPDLLTIWNPKIETGVESSVEVWKDDVECENCGKMGSYVLRDDRSGVGVCRKDILDGKTVIEVIELPSNHEY